MARKIKPLNRQQTFNRVWNTFVKRRRGPGMEGESCRYRGDNGTRCAIGACIPDSYYRSEFEDQLPSNFFVPPWMRSLFTEDVSGGFLIGLQRAHDEAALSRPFLPRVRRKLIEFAERHHLNIPA